MIHKFIMELTDDVKGYLYEVDDLERKYGIEPIEEHDKQIRADAIEECINELREEHECWINRGKNDYAFGVRLCIEVLEQLKEQK